MGGSNSNSNSNMQGSKGQHGKGQNAPKVPIPPKVGQQPLPGALGGSPPAGTPTPGPIPQNYGGSKSGTPPAVQQPPTSNAGNVPPGAVSAYLSAARGRMF